MLDWNKLLTEKRLGQEDESTERNSTARSQFQRDYDRIIFSSPFRRLQNKTQVFPLPGSVFVHNRLTHSLEVASVGRSLGNVVAIGLRQRKALDHPELLDDLGAIVSSACLAHDLGNPPFGHSGEKAISKYFAESKNELLRSNLTEAQYLDLINFEGNANALRLLAHQFTGRRKGGFGLTYSSIATLMKYPCTSPVLGTKRSPYKKYGVFQTEKDILEQVMGELGIPKISDTDDVYGRHPLVFMVEAADDICYQIVDLEDAHRLNILSTAKTRELMLAFFDATNDKSQLESVTKLLDSVADENEQITILRSRVINKLIEECTKVFWEKYDDIMNCRYHSNLIDDIDVCYKKAMEEVKNVAVSKIYNARSVIEIQIAGHKILGELLSEFIDAVLKNDSLYSSQLLQLLPIQLVCNTNNPFEQIMSVVDFISGMTDIYALELYRKIKGISFSVIH